MQEYDLNQLALEICNRLNIKTNGKTTGNISVHCFNPYHIDKNPSCSVSLDKAIFHCWSCGFSGSLIKHYRLKTGRSIFKDLNIKSTFSFKDDDSYVTADFSRIPETDFQFKGQLYPIDAVDLSRAWIKKRGFDVDVLKKNRVQFLKFGKTVKRSDPSDKTKWRSYFDMAMIPIYEGGKLICFEARTLRSKSEHIQHLIQKGRDPEKISYKKVLYPKGGSTKTLYQWEQLDKEKPLYVVEGLMDLLSLRSNLFFENSTTTFGRSINERQFYLLSFFKEIIFIPNNDIPGISALEQLKKRDLKVKVLPLPLQYNDVNEVLQKGVSLHELISKGWLKKEQDLSDFPIKNYISIFEKEE